MQKKVLVVLSSILAAGLAACADTDGDGKPDGGLPLAEVHGTIQGPGGVEYAAPYVGLVWVNWGDDSSYVPDFIEQVTAIDASRMPVSFSLSVFQPPPPGAYNVISDWDGANELGRMAMAMVVAVDDVNRDGSFVVNETGIDAPDQLFGVSWTEALLHLPAPLAREAAEMMFSNPQAATAGFHVARFDYCTGLMTIVDDGTFAIRTFPASYTFPDPGMEEETPDCGGPVEPGTGVCADPESEACATCLDQALHACFTVTCGAEMDALTACAEANGCEMDTQAGYACVETSCATELNGVEACLYTCDGWEACYGGPIEG